MPLQTTVVGAYPCPEYLKIPKWFPDANQYGAADYSKFIEKSNSEGKYNSVNHRLI